MQTVGLTFPAFIVVDDVLYATKGLPAGLVRKENESLGDAALLFTNKLKAELFIRDEKKPAYRLL